MLPSPFSPIFYGAPNDLDSLSYPFLFSLMLHFWLSAQDVRMDEELRDVEADKE
jgi:hypothetical protein